MDVTSLLALVDDLYPNAESSATKVDKVIGGQSVTVMSLTGNLWINPLGTAVANHTSIKLLAGERINLVVKGTLSMISDATGTDWNVVVWDI